MIRRPPRSTQSRSSAASDVYKRQLYRHQMPIYLPVKVEQMYFDGSPRCGNDRRTNANVADAIHNYPIYHSSHRIYTIAGEQFHGIGNLDICCWETKESSH